jgi:hypothetical protein
MDDLSTLPRNDTQRALAFYREMRKQGPVSGDTMQTLFMLQDDATELMELLGKED